MHCAVCSSPDLYYISDDKKKGLCNRIECFFEMMSIVKLKKNLKMISIEEIEKELKLLTEIKRF